MGVLKFEKAYNYQPEDLNYHFWKIKRAQLLDASKRTEEIRLIIKRFHELAFFSHHSTCNFIEKYYKDYRPRMDAVLNKQDDLIADDIETLRGIFLEYRKAVSEKLETFTPHIIENQTATTPLSSIDDTLAELELCANLSKNPSHNGITENEKQRLTNSLICRLNQNFYDAVNIICVKYGKINAVYNDILRQFNDGCFAAKSEDPAKVANVLAPILDSYYIKIDPKIKAQLRAIAVAHGNNVQKVQNPSYLNQYLIDAGPNETQAFIKKLNAYRDKRTTNKAPYHYWGLFSCFAYSFSRQEKIDAVNAFIGAINGEKVNLTSHLNVLRNGELGREIRAFIKAGHADPIVGCTCRTVRDFVAAVQTDLNDQDTKNLFRVTI